MSEVIGLKYIIFSTDTKLQPWPRPAPRSLFSLEVTIHFGTEARLEIGC